MRTSKPISTISYNSQEFLVTKLEELIKERKISDYVFINHYPEEDEKKEHIHLWIKPNTLIDTMDLQDFLSELDIENPTKPLKCIDFRFGKIDDWIPYTQHFKPYLAMKCESRQYHYTKDDFVYYDEDTFDELYNHAFRGSEWASHLQILEKLQDTTLNPSDLILSGSVPLNLACNLRALMDMDKTRRNGRKGHE